jgi:hypothetical protein
MFSQQNLFAIRITGLKEHVLHFSWALTKPARTREACQRSVDTMQPYIVRKP